TEFAGQLNLSFTDGKTKHSTRVIPREETGGASVSATNVGKRHACLHAGAIGAMAQHELLSPHNIPFPIQKKPVMNVIAPITAVHPGELVVVMAYFLCGNGTRVRRVG